MVLRLPTAVSCDSVNQMGVVSRVNKRMTPGFAILEADEGDWSYVARQPGAMCIENATVLYVLRERHGLRWCEDRRVGLAERWSRWAVTYISTGSASQHQGG
jgi:hypothetical protein